MISAFTFFAVCGIIIHPYSYDFVQIGLRFFDAAASSTAKAVPCPYKSCPNRCTKNVSTYQSGTLSDSALTVDGIFGLGQGPLSAISQLASRGVIPPVFSHCLKGEGLGGGTFVLGEITELGMVYTPLVPAQPHYNLYLQSIAVNGQLLPVDPAVFATSTGRGTFVDSGTTLAYLVEEAYESFLSAVSTLLCFCPFYFLMNMCFCLLCCFYVLFVFCS
ncbi:unnamed protein product [Linum trigynum]|uniref:Peptidase A1 domain-containing protein n=1 Tax=Linum trigynum TaxID=586398 RepID=A0AAV2F4V9_9ROSI